MLTVLSAEFTTAKSSLPSPLKSPATMATGPLPVAGGAGNAVNAPVPLPLRMLMVLSVLFSTARSIKPLPLKSPAATLCGLLPTVTGEVLPATVCCWIAPVLSPATPKSKLLLVVSRRDTFPVGEGLALPIPAMVAFRDQLPAEPPVLIRLAVVGYRPVMVTLSAGVEELVRKALGALKVATMECVPIPPNSWCRTAWPFVTFADCTWTVPSTSVMLLKVSRKVTVPPVSGVPPACTVAVILTTVPLAVLVGFTESVVVVVVCAPATTVYDITINKAAHREVRGLLRRVAFPRSFASLEFLNILSVLPEICGNPSASERNVVRKQSCESTYLAATVRIQRGPDVVLADDDWQKRNEEVTLRGHFMNSGISKPF